MSGADNNHAGRVREEDAFDVVAVADWLRQHADDPTGLDGTPGVSQFGGGASNLTYQLDFDRRAVILRRPPAGQKARGAHDMGREFRIQRALEPGFGLVPHMVGFCEDPSVIGSDFYVMDRLDGTILRRDVPDGMTLDEGQVRDLCTNALDVLVDLHGVDVDAVGLGHLGKGEGYVARQVTGWSERYRRAVTDDARDFERVMAWLDERQPADVGEVLIHNDFRFDNLVLEAGDPTRVVGVLDWEMATVGDPLMDLGGMAAYWVEAGDDEFFQQFRRQPTHLPGMLTREEMLAYYCERTGRAVSAEQWRFYEVFGLFRLAVIAQQIYYRFFHGQTHNEAYAIFGPAAHYLEDRALSRIGEG